MAIATEPVVKLPTLMFPAGVRPRSGLVVLRVIVEEEPATAPVLTSHKLGE